MAVSEHEAARYNSPLNNPCIKEAELTRKCLEANNYEGENCGAYFENYKECKKFWHMIRKKRSRQGLSPLPDPEEREKIKQEFFKSKKNS